MRQTIRLCCGGLFYLFNEEAANLTYRRRRYNFGLSATSERARPLVRPPAPGRLRLSSTPAASPLLRYPCLHSPFRFPRIQESAGPGPPAPPRIWPNTEESKGPLLLLLLQYYCISALRITIVTVTTTTTTQSVPNKTGPKCDEHSARAAGKTPSAFLVHVFVFLLN